MVITNNSRVDKHNYFIFNQALKLKFELGEILNFQLISAKYLFSCK